MYSILQNKSKRAKNDMVQFTQSLVKTPSLSLREEKIARLVERKMKELEYDRVFQDDWGNVVGVIYGQSAEPTVVLNSHMDVVDPEAIEGWTYDPYEGVIESDKLFGSGASDCKSGLAAQIYAGALIKHSLLPLKGNLVVAATVAEENGRSIGVRGLIQETLPSLELKPTYFILGESTNLNLYYGHDGWVDLDIMVEGEQPFHVEDVANGIYRDLEENYFHKAARENEEAWRVQPPEYEEKAGRRRANIHLSQKLYQDENHEEVIHNLKKNASYVAENYGSVAVKVDVKKESQKLYTGKTTVVRNITNAWATDPYHPLIERSRQTLAAAGYNVKPEKWELNKLEMGTAGSVLMNEFSIPTIGFGPGLLEMAHAPNECVAIDNIPGAAYGTSAMIHGLIGYPVFGWTSDEI